jgi:hypothetical protein
MGVAPLLLLSGFEDRQIGRGENAPIARELEE